VSVQRREPCQDLFEDCHIVRIQHGIAEMLLDLFAGRPQELPIAARACIG